MTDTPTDNQAFGFAIGDFEYLSSIRARHYDALCKDIASGHANEMDCIEAIRDLCKDNERLAVLSRRKAATGEALRVRAEAAEAELARLQPLIDAAHGLSFGEDWNKGNAAIRHGYRRKLLVAIGRIMGKDASPQAEAAATRAGKE
jgi:hypothetical protein